jgi:hypothetical protein
MGCAVCGADIAAAREQLAARTARNRRRRGGIDVPEFRISDEGWKIAITLLLALAAPLLGILFAAYFAYNSYGTQRWIMVGLGVLAAIPLLTGVSLWGRFFFGY